MYSSRQQLEEQIQKTAQFEELTGSILDAVAAETNLKATERKYLLKMIAKKANVSLEDLKKDLFTHPMHDHETHHTVAMRVIEHFGAQNLVNSQGKIWRWNQTGLWEAVEDRVIRKIIHECMESTKVTKTAVDSVLDIFKTEIFAPDHHFNIDTRAINCLNGELHFINGEWQLQPHRRENYRTSQIPIAYDPQATAPRFEHFLEEVFQGDPDKDEKKIILCEMLGYSILTSCEFEKFIILIGSGANGKSVLLHVVERLVGHTNVSAVQPMQFDNRFQRAHLFGKLVNVITEIPEGAELPDAQIKAIVSGERTTAEYKHKPPFDFHPYCTCWFGTNHMPHSRDFSDALVRRVIILAFNQKFEGEKRDIHLKDKLTRELPGILNFALEGVAGLFDRKEFTRCFSNEEAQKRWLFDCDQVAQFIADVCDLGVGKRSSSSDIFKAYEVWAQEMGIRKRLGHNGLTSRLQKFGVLPDRGTNGQRMLYGIAIKEI